MKPLFVLIVGLAALSSPSCQAHRHGLAPDEEVLTIELTRGLG